MAYTGTSVVDYLKSVGKSSDFTTRKTLAAQLGIANYTGTAAQNTQLLNSLRSAETKPPASTPQLSTATNTGATPPKVLPQTAEVVSLPQQPKVLPQTAEVVSMPEQPQAPAPVPSGGSGGGTTVPTGSATTPKVDVPPDLANSPYFQQLDDNNKAIVAYFYNIQQSGNTEKAAKFQEALKIAASQADPYFREQINIISDEVSRSLGTLDADLVSREGELMARKKQIQDDLTYNKEFLSLEQQAELTRISDQYDTDLEATRDNMALKGLTSSSFRNRAEESLGETNAGVIESVQRRSAKQVRDLETGSAANLESIGRQVQDVQRTATEGKTSVVRKAEGYLGTEGVNKIPGTSGYAQGGISGGIIEDKTIDVLTRANALLQGSMPSIDTKTP